MVKKMSHLKTITMIFIVILMVGCIPKSLSNIGQESTIDTNSLRAEVAGTVVAQITDEAIRNPSATFTSIVPTNTQIVASPTTKVLPSNTAFPVIPTATLKPVVKYPTYTPTYYTDSAVVVTKWPADGQSLGANTDFDIRWTVKNTGQRAWTSDFYYRYLSGVKGSKGTMYYVPTNLSVGDETQLIVDMIAPGQPGLYNTYWQLVNDDGVVILTLYVVFYVH